MDRRTFGLQVMCALAAATPLAARTQQENWGHGLAARLREIEAGTQGRLGVAILDTATGALQGHRLDERFPMCSTFKWLAAAYVLKRVDDGQERLDRRIRYGHEVLLPHSPVTQRHAGGEGMTLAGLCEATITISDNAAANLILGTYGGPQGLTRFVRTLGDEVTRLDRTEPELNESLPDDPRDTTTPRAMSLLLRKALLGDALSPASRAQLVQWMQATRTNANRLGAGLPKGWRLGSKTGTGARGSTNDVGVYWPPGRAPIVVSVYVTGTQAELPVRERAIAQVAGLVTASRKG